MSSSMLNSVMGEMLNTSTKTTAKLIYVEVDELKINPLNPIPDSKLEKQRVIEMAESIKEGGLIQPIVAEIVQGEKVIISGNTRWKAISLLTEQNISYRFLQKELDGEIPVLIMPSSEDETENIIAQLRSNRYRQLTKEEREEIVIKAHECYQIQCDQGKRPKGREREWITMLTGISDGTVKTILSELNQTTADSSINESEELGQIAPEKEKASEAIKLSKKITALIKNLDKIDFDQYDEEEKGLLEIKLKELLTTIESLL